MAIRAKSNNFTKSKSNKNKITSVMLNSQTALCSEARLTRVPFTMYDTGAAVLRSDLLLLLRLATRWQCCHVEKGEDTCRNVVKVKKVALCLYELIFSPDDCRTPMLV